jgi:cephalosporin hydroxylase
VWRTADRLCSMRASAKRWIAVESSASISISGLITVRRSKSTACAAITISSRVVQSPRTSSKGSASLQAARNHVLAELEAYAPFVTTGSYIVAADGIMKNLVNAPRSGSDWATNNPYEAAKRFAAGHPEFVIEQPRWRFNESNGLRSSVTYWPGAWLKRVGSGLNEA